MYVCTCAYMYVCMRTYVRTYIHTYICMYALLVRVRVSARECVRGRVCALCVLFFLAGGPCVSTRNTHEHHTLKRMARGKCSCPSVHAHQARKLCFGLTWCCGRTSRRTTPVFFPPLKRLSLSSRCVGARARARVRASGVCV